MPAWEDSSTVASSRDRLRREAPRELTTKLVADEVDERADAQLLTRVMDEDEQRERACRCQRERGQHRQARHRVVTGPGVDRAKGEDRERERGAEDRDRELVAPIAKQRAHDSW